MKVLTDLFGPATDHELTGWLFVKGLALVYAAAFASLAIQIDGLAGPDGILPLQRLLDGAFAEQGTIALLRLPTLFWLNSSDAALQGAAFAGAVVALLLALGWVRRRPALIALFVLYLSLVHAGQIFMRFQWDTLLLESGFLAIFLVDAPTRLIVLLFDWLLFRLRFLSGYFKLASGDPSWRDFSALNYYFETQPLPHIGSWYAHHLWPGWLKAGVGFTLGIGHQPRVGPDRVLRHRERKVGAIAIENRSPLGGQLDRPASLVAVDGHDDLGLGRWVIDWLSEDQKVGTEVGDVQY